MAKKTNSLIWLYRLKPQYKTSALSLEWLPCNEESKVKIERMRPNMYEFKPKSPPPPTPNMIEDSKEND